MQVHMVEYVVGVRCIKLQLRKERNNLSLRNIGHTNREHALLVFAVILYRVWVKGFHLVVQGHRQKWGGASLTTQHHTKLVYFCQKLIPCINMNTIMIVLCWHAWPHGRIQAVHKCSTVCKCKNLISVFRCTIMVLVCVMVWDPANTTEIYTCFVSASCFHPAKLDFTATEGLTGLTSLPQKGNVPLLCGVLL